MLIGERKGFCSRRCFNQALSYDRVEFDRIRDGYKGPSGVVVSELR